MLRCGLLLEDESPLRYYPRLRAYPGIELVMFHRSASPSNSKASGSLSSDDSSNGSSPSSRDGMPVGCGREATRGWTSFTQQEIASRLIRWKGPLFLTGKGASLFCMIPLERRNGTQWKIAAIRGDDIR